MNTIHEKVKTDSRQRHMNSLMSVWEEKRPELRPIPCPGTHILPVEDHRSQLRWLQNLQVLRLYSMWQVIEHCIHNFLKPSSIL